MAINVRTERVRGFQPPWYTVYIYTCDKCGEEARIRQNWRGPMPRGAFKCSCENVIQFGR